MVEYNEIILINGEKHKYCKSCTDLLPVDKFYPIPRNKVGYNVRCKVCEMKKRREKYESTKPVWFSTDDILKGMGYDITGDIHKQFCDRHNLPYKEKESSL